MSTPAAPAPAAPTVMQPGGVVAPAPQATPSSPPVAPVAAPQGTPAAPLTPSQLAGNTVPPGPSISPDAPPAGPVVQPVVPPAATNVQPADGKPSALVVPPGTDPEVAKAITELGADPQKIADFFLQRDVQFRQQLDASWAKQRSDWTTELSKHVEYARNPAETTEAENRSVQKIPELQALHAKLSELGYDVLPEYRLALRAIGLRIPADKIGGAAGAPSTSPTGPEKTEAQKRAEFFSHPTSRRAQEEAQRRRPQR